MAKRSVLQPVVSPRKAAAPDAELIPAADPQPGPDRGEGVHPALLRHRAMRALKAEGPPSDLARYLRSDHVDREMRDLIADLIEPDAMTTATFKLRWAPITLAAARPVVLDWQSRSDGVDVPGIVLSVWLDARESGMSDKEALHIIKQKTGLGRTVALEYKKDLKGIDIGKPKPVGAFR